MLFFTVCYENGECENYCKEEKLFTKVGEIFTNRFSCLGSEFDENCSIKHKACKQQSASGYRFEHDYTLDYPECCNKKMISTEIKFGPL